MSSCKGNVFLFHCLFRGVSGRTKSSEKSAPVTTACTPSSCDVRAVASAGAVLKRGYLSKKIWRFGRHTNYFVLRDDGKFYYYKNETAAEDPTKYKGFTAVKVSFLYSEITIIYSITVI